MRCAHVQAFTPTFIFSPSLIICSTHGDQNKKNAVCFLANSIMNLLTWQTLSQLCRLIQIHIDVIEIRRIMSVLFRWVLRTVVLRSSSHSLARRTIIGLAVVQGSELTLDPVSEGNVGRESSNVRLRLTKRSAKRKPHRHHCHNCHSQGSISRAWALVS